MAEIKKTVEELNSGDLGIFLWYVSNAWNPFKRKYWTRQLRKTLRILRAERTSRVDGFLFICDWTSQHSHLNKKTPWKRTGKTFDLETLNPKFWKIFRLFIKTFREVCEEIPGGKKGDMEFCPIVFMGFGYNMWPFKHNLQGIDAYAIWDPVARPYQVPIFDRIGEEYAAAYGANYKPPYKPGNEFAHGGNCIKWHDIGKWYQIMIEESCLNDTEIWKIIADRSHSDGVLPNVCEVTDCAKPGCCPVPDKKHGNDVYNHFNVKSSVQCEEHSIATIDDVKDTNALNIGGWRICRFHQDGGNKGNSRWNILGAWAKQGDPNEVYEMAHYMFTEAKRQNKTFIYAMMELKALWKKNLLGKWVCPKPLKYSYLPRNIDRQRLIKLREAYEDVYES